MEKSKAEKSPFSELFHVGVVVKDIDKVIERLSSLGVGPFEPYHKSLGIVSPVERRLRGKPTDCKLKTMAAQIGPIVLELIQPEGECIHSEFLDSKGEGLHHLGFYVDNLDEEVSRLAKQGLTPVMEASTTKGKFCAYFEPEEVGGIILELVEED